MPCTQLPSHPVGSGPTEQCEHLAPPVLASSLVFEPVIVLVCAPRSLDCESACASRATHHAKCVRVTPVRMPGKAKVARSCKDLYASSDRGRLLRPPKSVCGLVSKLTDVQNGQAKAMLRLKIWDWICRVFPPVATLWSRECGHWYRRSAPTPGPLGSSGVSMSGLPLVSPEYLPANLTRRAGRF